VGDRIPVGKTMLPVGVLAAWRRGTWVDRLVMGAAGGGLSVPVFGHFGRDVDSRVVYGGRIALLVGFSVAVLATGIGLALGLVVAGYVRVADALVMRVMDGLMAIPSILPAIALIAIARASLQSVLIAITVPEIPRVVRLVRSIVLTLREQPYVAATRALGTGFPRILPRHLLPNTLNLVGDGSGTSWTRAWPGGCSGPGGGRRRPA
jgi:ABC-type dipeptide/oligopeptide/nickel transport system permease subunit